MKEHYDRLGIDPTATSADIKAAYHAKLREFPAHTHPQEFKAIRTAYESIRQDGKQVYEDFFKPQPEQAKFDPDLIQTLKDQVMDKFEVNLAKMIHLTF